MKSNKMILAFAMIITGKIGCKKPWEANTINTESNGLSLELIRNNKEKGFGAIVIPDELKDNEFNIRIDHVADIKNNETRFVILSNENHPIIENDFLASIVITLGLTVILLSFS